MSKSGIFAVSLLLGATAFFPARVHSVSKATLTHSVTFVGTVSCSRCQGLQPHKGYTKWMWAIHSVSGGDNIVLRVGENTYYLQGDKNQLMMDMEDKVEVTGNLEGPILTVQTITRVVRNRQRQK